MGVGKMAQISPPPNVERRRALGCGCRSVCRLGRISIDPNVFAVQLGSIESESKSILVNSTRGTSNRIYSTLGPPPAPTTPISVLSPCTGILPGGVTVHSLTCTRPQDRQGTSDRWIPDLLGSRSLWKRRQFVIEAVVMATYELLRLVPILLQRSRGEIR